MYWARAILFVVGRIVTALIAGVGLGLDYSGGAIAKLTPGQWGRIGFIAFLVFVVLTGWRELDLWLQQKPRIKIRPFVDASQCAKLEIFNYGASAKFTATYKIIQGRHCDLTNMYMSHWETEDVIDGNASGVIAIAQKTHIHDSMLHTPAIELLFRTQDGTIGRQITGYWTTGNNGVIRETNPPPSVLLEMTVTSPTMLKKAFNRVRFELSQTTLADLKFAYVKTMTTRKLKTDKEGYLN
jgi:hypothetical protein